MEKNKFEQQLSVTFINEHGINTGNRKLIVDEETGNVYSCMPADTGYRVTLLDEVVYSSCTVFDID